jgi:hypothetical protein
MDDLAEERGQRLRKVGSNELQEESLEFRHVDIAQ